MNCRKCNTLIQTANKRLCSLCLKEKNAAYYIKNKEKLLFNNKNYRIKNKSIINAQRKIYRENNKEIIQQRNKIYEQNKLNNDPLFKIKKNLSKQMRNYINKNNESLFLILNYSSQQLKKHLESQFEYWMNWNNYGSFTLNWNDADQSTWKWNIDHIMPQSSFNFDSINHPDFKICWSLNNLRPLSAKENIIKGNKIIDLTINES